MSKEEWAGANKLIIQSGVDLYSLQDEHFLYLSIHYDTAQYQNYFVDLYVEVGKDSLLNIHASQQLGEKLLIGNSWTDSELAFNWGYIKDWTTNKINFDRKNKVYRDFHWEKEVINFPENGEFYTTQNWKLYHFE